jgi:hypothetical protein
MTLKEQLRSTTALPAIAGNRVDQPQVAGPAAPQFVTEHTIERVLGVPVKTLRNWRVNGRGPPFAKLGSSVRYELSTAIRWAQDRTVNSTSELPS